VQWKVASLELFCTVFDIPVHRQARANFVNLWVKVTEGALDTKVHMCRSKKMTARQALHNLPKPVQIVYMQPLDFCSRVITLDPLDCPTKD